MSSSFTAIGKLTRLRRIFHNDGRAVMVAINQGITMGPRDGIESVEQIVNQLLPQGPDSFTLHKGAAQCLNGLYAGRAALILKLTNRSRFFGPEEIQVASLEDAVALGADAVSLGLTLCDSKEAETLRLVGGLVSAAQQVGMPTVAHAYPSGSLIDDSQRHSLTNVGYATRVARELGIDVIKTYWTGSAESFAKIVEFGAPCPVVISGGPKCATLRDCYDMTWQGIQAGCHGITYGRNIWQHAFPAAVLAGLVAIVHEQADVEQALDLASTLANQTLE